MNNLPPGVSHADIDHAAEDRDEPENNCLRCHGEGISDDLETGLSYRIACPECGGTGKRAIRLSADQQEQEG
jgi:DnaJ-class molecular chaperone